MTFNVYLHCNVNLQLNRLRSISQGILESLQTFLALYSPSLYVLLVLPCYTNAVDKPSGDSNEILMCQRIYNTLIAL